MTKTERPVEVVWNCPAVAEAMPSPDKGESGKMKLLYHGSLVPERLPLSVIDALAHFGDRVHLTIVGYETIGSSGYWEKLRQRALSLGAGEQVQYLGTKAGRDELLRVCRQCDVGLSLIPHSTGDLNMNAMTGASNKPFDYLACGLALLVSDLPNWREMFAAPGYGKCCNPEDADSIALAIRWFLENPRKMRAMGAAGRLQIQMEWNYETQFGNVLRTLQ
jgi:glycosyltransferase involved in cell wall biosynthesis